MVPPVAFDFSQLFEPDEYLYFMADSLREENSPAQVDFLVHALAMTPPMRVLDLGCGHGRHANELARRGYKVVGIDLVEGFLEVARREAEREGLSVEYHQGDIGAFEADGFFDRAVCLFDAFGFFDDLHNLSVLRCTHRALQPGGLFLLDLRTREWMLRVPPVSVTDKGNGDLMIDRHHFDIESGRFVDRRTTIRDGKLRDVSFSVRLYAYTEIRTLLESVGFVVDAAYGGYDGSPLSLNKNRTLVVARKPLAHEVPGATAPGAAPMPEGAVG